MYSGDFVSFCCASHFACHTVEPDAEDSRCDYTEQEKPTTTKEEADPGQPVQPATESGSG